MAAERQRQPPQHFSADKTECAGDCSSGAYSIVPWRWMGLEGKRIWTVIGLLAVVRLDFPIDKLFKK